MGDGLLSHDDPVIRSTALQLFQTLADDERTIALWVKALGDAFEDDWRAASP